MARCDDEVFWVYDLPTAWSQVFWGIVLGGVYAVVADGHLLFQPYYTTVVTNDGVYTGLNVVSLMAVAVFCIRFFAPPPAQKARSNRRLAAFQRLGTGLAIGGMTAMVLMFECFEFEHFFMRSS